MDTKSALVTGATGFIGSTLARELHNQGFEVRVLVRKTSKLIYLEDLPVKRVAGDLRVPDSLKDAVSGVNYVFHLAGAVSSKTEDGYYKHNSIGTRNLAKAVSDAGALVKRFVYVSSLAAGGPAKSIEPRNESEPDAPVSAYGKSKGEGEKHLLEFKNLFPITIVRPPIVYGPRDKGMFVFFKTVSKRIMPVLTGAGVEKKKYYSQVHVLDLCQGILKAALVTTSEVPSGEIFYISGDERVSYNDLLKKMSTALDVKALSLPVPGWLVKGLAFSLSGLSQITGKTYPFNKDKLNEILPDYWICSNEKAKKQIGYKPEYCLDKGFQETVKWYRENKWL